MKKYKNFVGIDVSKLSLDVIVLNAQSPDKAKYFEVNNEVEAIKCLIKKLPDDVLVCFEHTGNYGLKLSYQLAEKGIDFWIENPLLIKRYKGFSRGKTDKADAKDIANYALTHQHKAKLYKIDKDNLLKIRLLLCQRKKLVKCIITLKQHQENYANYPKAIKRQVEKLNERQVKYLKKEVKLVEEQIEKVLKEDEGLGKIVELTKSIKGIGNQTAWNLLIKTRGFTCFKSARALACHIGIAPFEYSSGTSVRGRTKVNHYADKSLKALMNMAALTAKKYDPELKAYYEKKVAEGKNKMLIINNIRNKLLARVFAVVKRGTPFVNTQNYLAK